MTTLTIKNIPEHLLEGLRKRAKRNRRSLNNEAIVIFETVLDIPSLDVEEMIASTAKFRELTEGYSVDPDTLTMWINEGRE